MVVRCILGCFHYLRDICEGAHLGVLARVDRCSSRLHAIDGDKLRRLGTRLSVRYAVRAGVQVLSTADVGIGQQE